MIVRMAGFMTHKETELDLGGAPGLTVVTGPNGAGKSAVYEAVAVARWGKTLWHGSGAAWTAGEGFVEAEEDGLVVRRSFPGGPTVRGRDAPAKFESASKAQAWLTALLGEQDVWRRTSVFGEEEGLFTRATDGERKRLLERLIGVARFDAALASCRKDLEAEQRRYDGMDGAEREISVHIEGLRRQRDAGAEEVERLAPAADVAALRERLARLDAGLAAARADRDALAKETADLRIAASNERNRAAASRDRLALVASGKCETCEQPLPPIVLDGFRVRALTAKKAADDAAAAAAAKTTEAEEQLAEVEEDAGVIGRKQAALREEISAAVAVKAAAAGATARAEKARADLDAEIAAMEKDLEDVKAKILAARRELALARAGELVLGLKGARAAVLARALGGVEAAANLWFSRLATERTRGLRVELKPYTELKSRDGQSDAISFSIGGRDYRSFSKGERRRVDVAMVFALSQLTIEVGRGPLFFDEAFDGLDADGCAVVAAALADVAKGRRVVVITHSEDLVSRLGAGPRVRVEDGRIVA